MSSKKSARRGKGKPDELDESLHEAIKREEDAMAGEDIEAEVTAEAAETEEIAVTEEAVTPMEAVETEEAVPEETANPAESSEKEKLTPRLLLAKLANKLLPEKTPFEIVRRVLMLVCLATFIISGSRLIKNLVDYKRGADIYGSISDNIFDMNLGGEGAVSLLSKAPMAQRIPDYYTLIRDGDEWADTTDNIDRNIKFEQMKANLNYLKSINPDIYGYIHIEGTNISFPLVQGKDNEYYLDHAYNNEYVVVGSVFVDYRLDRNIENNYNTVIYGHNMRDGNMLNNVTLFYDEEVFRSKLIEIYTFDGIYTFEPFSVFETTQYHKYAEMEFATGEDFVAFCEHMQRCSPITKDMTFTPEDRIITLSTCTTAAETYFTGRNALHAKLIKVER